MQAWGWSVLVCGYLEGLVLEDDTNMYLLEFGPEKSVVSIENSLWVSGKTLAYIAPWFEPVDNCVVNPCIGVDNLVGWLWGHSGGPVDKLWLECLDHLAT